MTGSQAIGKFFEARFARIYQVYLLAVLLVRRFVTSNNAMSAPQYDLVQKWMITGKLDFDNWNGPAWILSVELVFYLLLPMPNKLVLDRRKSQFSS